MIAPSCAKCSLNDCTKLKHGIGDVNAPIVLVSECPTVLEAKSNSLFTGRSAELLNRLLKGAGLTRSDCYITTSVLCAPSPYRSPKAKEYKACRERLFSEILECKKRKVVVALGATATKAVLPGTAGVKQIRGSFIKSDDLECYVLPTFHPSITFREPKLHQDILHDLTKAGQLVFEGEKSLITDGSVEYVFVNEQSLFDALIVRLAEVDAIVGLDVENVKETGELICLGLSWSERTAAVISAEILSMDNVNLLSRALARKILITHNGKHDINILRQHGFTDIRVGGDTMYQSYVLDETLYAKEEMRGEHGLKYLVQDILGIPIWNGKIKKWYPDLRECPNMEDVWEYNAKDVAYTRMLYLTLEDRLDAKGKDVLTNIMYPVTHVLGKMQYVGAKADRGYLIKLDVQLTLEQDERLQQMYDLCRCTFNPNSPKQVEYLLYNYLKLPVPGRISTDKEALKLLQDEHPVIPILRTYNNRKKFHGTYVRGLLNGVDIEDRVHTSFNVARTATGRLSSSGPNL